MAVSKRTLASPANSNDGKNSRLIPKEAEIHIRKSPYTAQIIKIGTNRFYDILETKLNKK